MRIDTCGRKVPDFLVVILGLIALTYICIKVWSTHMAQVDWVIAMSGFSPIDWVNHHRLKENFINDFPQGTQTYDKSFFMNGYLLADLAFGIRPEKLIPGVILFEMLFMGVAAVVFFRALLPSAMQIAAFVFSVLIVNSSARGMELAGFGGPFFWGLYYNFADGMRLIALAMLLQRNFLSAAVLFALSVMTHPLMGAMGLIFALGFIAIERKKLDRNKMYWSGTVFLSLVAGWWLYHLRGVGVASGEIPSSAWIAFSRAFSYHFYPVDNGLLTYAFERKFLAFLGLLVLAYHYLYRITLPDRQRRGILLGAGLLLATTSIGLTISHWSDDPFLIKLTLTRASDMLILVSLAVVVAGLLTTLQKDKPLQAGIAAGLLFAPFMAPPFPVVYVFLAVILGMPIFCGGRMVARSWVELVLLFAFGVLLLIYYWLGYAHSAYATVYWGNAGLLLISVCVGCAVLMANLLRSRSDVVRRVCLAAVMIFLIPISLRWTAPSNYGLGDRPMGRAYMNAQFWARENTSIEALFMVDPTIYYGWRDYSQRSSFGNMREWLHTSWLYDSKKVSYEEGLRRAAEFGIDPSNYLDEKPPLRGFDLLDRDFGERFYSYDTGWFLNMSRKYSIDYLVMKKSRMTRELSLPIVFENDFFVIFSLPSRE